MTLVVHLLDDFLDSVERLPNELQTNFNEIYRLEEQIDLLTKSLTRKRIIFMKAKEKGLDTANFIKRIEKEEAKGKHQTFIIISAHSFRKENPSHPKAAEQLARFAEALRQGNK